MILTMSLLYEFSYRKVYFTWESKLLARSVKNVPTCFEILRQECQ